MITNTVTTTTTDISLAKLIPCPANVRRTGASSGIEALAASIQAHGLLQSIVVRPKLDGEGQASDRYEVVAGGRRLAALKLLAKQKRITKSIPVPCRVLDTDGVDGAEASLAENIVRQDMHPADQFEAFHALRQGGIGIGIEDIAARFGVSAHTVRQRLRLASISPALIQAYRDEELTLDHLTAFGVTEDQEAQERVLGQLQTWQRNPDTSDEQVVDAITKAADAIGTRGFTPRFLLSEWRHVVDAWQIADVVAYSRVPRLGRKNRMSAGQRERLWPVFEAVRASLAKRGLATWSQIYGEVAAHYAARPESRSAISLWMKPRISALPSCAFSRRSRPLILMHCSLPAILGSGYSSSRSRGESWAWMCEAVPRR